MKTTTYNIIHAEHGYIVGIAHSEAQARQIVDAAYMHDCTECMICVRRKRGTHHEAQQ